MSPFDLPPRRYSCDEIAAWPDEATRELSNGKPWTLYAPEYGRTLAYAQAVGNVLGWLHENNRNSMGGEIFHLLDWQLDEWNSLVADLCFYRRERLDREEIRRADGQCLLAAPNLLIHVRDETSATFAAHRQLKICQSRAVPFFWAIEAETRRGLALHLEDGNYIPETDYREDEVFSCPLFPGAQLTLETIFAEVAP